MKRGGRHLILSFLCVVISLVTLGGLLSPTINVAAVDEDTTTVEQTTNDEDNQSDSTDDSNDSTSSDDSENSCEAGLFGFGWMLCPGQNLITSIFSNFLQFIADSLEWTLLTDDTDTIRDVWQDFLNIANIVFAICFLVMIYSMATSTGLSNYDLKKILPRLIVVAIAVNLSFYLCAALVDVSNITGKGVYDLMVSHTSGSGWQNLDVNIVTSIIGAAAAAIAVVFLGGAAVVGLLIIIIAISFRQLALMLLIIVSPVAIALYTLPNTEKFGKMWFSWFTRMLFVYPMFMAVWGASVLVSNILSTTSASTGETLVPFLVNIVSAIAPALAILPLFKASGGLMAGITKAMQGSSAAKKGAPAVTSAIQRSKPVDFGRRKVSSAALGIQNTFGNTPIIGGLLRGNAANRLVNYSQDFAAAQDKKAMESATNWAKGLTGDQQRSLFNNGWYINGNRKVRVADTHKLRANIEAYKNSADAGEWHDAMRRVNKHANWLSSAGRGLEAKQLRSTFMGSAMDSKAMVIGGGALGGWADKGWLDRQFDAKYGQAAAKFASKQTSVNAVSSLSPAAGKDMINSMIDGLKDINTLSGEEREQARNDICTGFGNISNAATQALKVKKSQHAMNNEQRATIEKISQLGGKTRTTSQQKIAEKYNLDQIIDRYNTQVEHYREAVSSGDQSRIRSAASELYSSTRPAKEFVLRMQSDASYVSDYNNMSQADRDCIDKMNRLTAGSIPEPVTAWNKI